jgi:hypothetical protein
MCVVNRRLAALVLAISGLGLAAYGVLVDAFTTISCPPLPQGAICQAVLVKEIGESLAILGTIMFIVGLFLFAAWSRRSQTGASGSQDTV